MGPGPRKEMKLILAISFIKTDLDYGLIREIKQRWHLFSCNLPVVQAEVCQEVEGLLGQLLPETKSMDTKKKFIFRP
jgi:hypothetical protein